MLLEQAERVAAADTRVDARLFMSVGGLESESMISNMEQAARLLADVDGPYFLDAYREVHGEK